MLSYISGTLWMHFVYNADKMKTISEENHLVRLAAVSMKGNPTI